MQCFSLAKFHYKSIILDQLSLPAIRRGEDVEVYYPTVDGRIMELDFKEVVHDVQSKYQRVMVAKSDSLGNVLILDGDLSRFWMLPSKLNDSMRRYFVFVEWNISAVHHLRSCVMRSFELILCGFSLRYTFKYECFLHCECYENYFFKCKKMAFEDMGESDTIYSHTLMQKGKINYAVSFQNFDSHHIHCWN